MESGCCLSWGFYGVQILGKVRQDGGGVSFEKIVVSR